MIKALAEFKGFNYQANHILIALAMSVLLSKYGAPMWFALIVPVLFYALREVYQLYYLKRTERFDWGGCVPVWISHFLITLLWYF